MVLAFPAFDFEACSCLAIGPACPGRQQAQQPRSESAGLHRAAAEEIENKENASRAASKRLSSTLQF
jgi:hypothetical protein